MKLSEIGQFGMIDIIAGMIEKRRDDSKESWRNLVIGAGDDCAVWKSSRGIQFAKVDCQIEGIHFKRELMDWEDLGWKALAVNLSDIAAMGGTPEYALVSLGLPLDTEVENVVSLYRGILELAAASGTVVAGGHLSGSPVIMVDINVIGRAGGPEGHYLARNSARSGDQIGVTGWLGSAAAGRELLENGRGSGPSEDILKRAFCRPDPRLKEGILLVSKGVRTGLDVSDGLLADLGHICRESAVNAVINLSRLPIRNEVLKLFGERARDLALSGGEDYQLLFTAPPDVMNTVLKYKEYPISVIGEISGRGAGEIQVIDQNGGVYQPDGKGWDHFRQTG